MPILSSLFAFSVEPQIVCPEATTADLPYINLVYIYIYIQCQSRRLRREIDIKRKSGSEVSGYNTDIFFLRLLFDSPYITD